MKHILLLLFFLQNTQIVSAQKTDPLKFGIRMSVTNVLEKKDLTISLLFHNNTIDSTILIPKILSHGYKKGQHPCLVGDIIWEVELKSNAGYKQQSLTLIVKQFSDFTPENERYDTLLPGRQVEKYFNLGLYYHIKKGSYRVRAKYIPIHQNVNSGKTLYSKWVSFYLRKTINYLEL